MAVINGRIRHIEDFLESAAVLANSDGGTCVGCIWSYFPAIANRTVLIDWWSVGSLAPLPRADSPGRTPPRSPWASSCARFQVAPFECFPIHLARHCRGVFVSSAGQLLIAAWMNTNATSGKDTDWGPPILGFSIFSLRKNPGLREFRFTIFASGTTVECGVRHSFSRRKKWTWPRRCSRTSSELKISFIR